MMKKIKFFSLLLVLPAFALILSGCGKSVSKITGEKAAEKILEKQMGGQANVDIDNGNVKVKSERGNIETGDNVKVPADFPSDVYVIDGKIITAISSPADKTFTISIDTDTSPEEASSVYQEKFKADGWKITGTMSYEGSSSVTAEKDTRTASVFMNKNGDKTNVVLGVMEKQ